MNASNDTSLLHTFLLAKKSVRGVLLDGTILAREMQTRHGLTPLESLILGQALMVTTLMASTLKGHDETALRIDGSGAAKGLIAEATATGEVRGYLKRVPIPLSPSLQSFDAGQFGNETALLNTLTLLWGDGFLTVTRYQEEGGQPFSSRVSLQSGDIGAEVMRYYLLSEQIPTAIHLQIVFDHQGRVAGAGGLLLQAMPGVNTSVFAALEQKIQALPALGQAMADGQKIPAWLHEHFGSFSPEILEERPVRLQCRCGEKQTRLLLFHLPLADLEEMRDHGPFPVQVNCHFCNEHYLFDQKALAEICREKRLKAEG
jgi:molecular chaperone Hsp33